MAKRKPEENFNVDEDELANMFGDADSSPPPQETGGTRKMRRSGKARKMKTKKSSKSRSRKSTRRRHKNRRTR